MQFTLSAWGVKYFLPFHREPSRTCPMLVGTCAEFRARSRDKFVHRIHASIIDHLRTRYHASPVARRPFTAHESTRRALESALRPARACSIYVICYTNCSTKVLASGGPPLRSLLIDAARAYGPQGATWISRALSGNERPAGDHACTAARRSLSLARWPGERRKKQALVQRCGSRRWPRRPSRRG